MDKISIVVIGFVVSLLTGCDESGTGNNTNKYPKSTFSYSDWKDCVNHQQWVELAQREGLSSAEDRKWRICGTKP